MNEYSKNVQTNAKLFNETYILEPWCNSGSTQKFDIRAKQLAHLCFDERITRRSPGSIIGTTQNVLHFQQNIWRRSTGGDRCPWLCPKLRQCRKFRRKCTMFYLPEGFFRS
eukprot:456356_1